MWSLSRILFKISSISFVFETSVTWSCPRIVKLSRRFSTKCPQMPESITTRARIRSWTCCLTWIKSFKWTFDQWLIDFCFFFVNYMFFFFNFHFSRFWKVSIQLLSKNEKERFDSLVELMILFNLNYRQEKTTDGQFGFVLDP